MGRTGRLLHPDNELSTRIEKLLEGKIVYRNLEDILETINTLL